MLTFLQRLTSVFLIPCLIADPLSASTFAATSKISFSQNAQDLGQKLFDQEAIVDPVIRALHFILHKPLAPAEETHLFEGIPISASSRWNRRDILKFLGLGALTVSVGGSKVLLSQSPHTSTDQQDALDYVQEIIDDVRSTGLPEDLVLRYQQELLKAYGTLNHYPSGDYDSSREEADKLMNAGRFLLDEGYFVLLSPGTFYKDSDGEAGWSYQTTLAVLDKKVDHRNLNGKDIPIYFIKEVRGNDQLIRPNEPTFSIIELGVIFVVSKNFDFIVDDIDNARHSFPSRDAGEREMQEIMRETFPLQSPDEVKKSLIQQSIVHELFHLLNPVRGPREEIPAYLGQIIFSKNPYFHLANLARLLRYTSHWPENQKRKITYTVAADDIFRELANELYPAQKIFKGNKTLTSRQAVKFILKLRKDDAMTWKSIRRAAAAVYRRTYGPLPAGEKIVAVRPNDLGPFVGNDSPLPIDVGKKALSGARHAALLLTLTLGMFAHGQVLKTQQSPSAQVKAMENSGSVQQNNDPIQLPFTAIGNVAHQIGKGDFKDLKKDLEHQAASIPVFHTKSAIQSALQEVKGALQSKPADPQAGLPLDLSGGKSNSNSDDKSNGTPPVPTAPELLPAEKMLLRQHELQVQQDQQHLQQLIPVPGETKPTAPAQKPKIVPGLSPLPAGAGMDGAQEEWQKEPHMMGQLGKRVSGPGGLRPLTIKPAGFQDDNEAFGSGEGPTRPGAPASGISRRGFLQASAMGLAALTLAPKTLAQQVATFVVNTNDPPRVKIQTLIRALENKDRRAAAAKELAGLHLEGVDLMRDILQALIEIQLQSPTDKDLQEAIRGILYAFRSDFAAALGLWMIAKEAADIRVRTQALTWLAQSSKAHDAIHTQDDYETLVPLLLNPELQSLAEQVLSQTAVNPVDGLTLQTAMDHTWTRAAIDSDPSVLAGLEDSFSRTIPPEYWIDKFQANLASPYFLKVMLQPDLLGKLSRDQKRILYDAAVDSLDDVQRQSASLQVLQVLSPDFSPRSFQIEKLFWAQSTADALGLESANEIGPILMQIADQPQTPSYLRARILPQVLPQASAVQARDAVLSDEQLLLDYKFAPYLNRVIQESNADRRVTLLRQINDDALSFIYNDPKSLKALFDMIGDSDVHDEVLRILEDYVGQVTVAHPDSLMSAYFLQKILESPRAEEPRMQKLAKNLLLPAPAFAPYLYTTTHNDSVRARLLHLSAADGMVWDPSVWAPAFNELLESKADPNASPEEADVYRVLDKFVKLNPDPSFRVRVLEHRAVSTLSQPGAVPLTSEELIFILANGQDPAARSQAMASLLRSTDLHSLILSPTAVRTVFEALLDPEMTADATALIAGLEAISMKVAFAHELILHSLIGPSETRTSAQAILQQLRPQLTDALHLIANENLNPRVAAASLTPSESAAPPARSGIRPLKSNQQFLDIKNESLPPDEQMRDRQKLNMSLTPAAGIGKTLSATPFDRDWNGIPYVSVEQQMGSAGFKVYRINDIEDLNSTYDAVEAEYKGLRLRGAKDNDPNMLNFVVQELGGNFIKYTDSKGVILTRTAQAPDGRSYVEIVGWDQGRGMPQSEFEKIRGDVERNNRIDLYDTHGKGLDSIVNIAAPTGGGMLIESMVNYSNGSRKGKWVLFGEPGKDGIPRVIAADDSPIPAGTRVTAIFYTADNKPVTSPAAGTRGSATTVGESHGTDFESAEVFQQPQNPLRKLEQLAQRGWQAGHALTMGSGEADGGGRITEYTPFLRLTREQILDVYTESVKAYRGGFGLAPAQKARVIYHILKTKSLPLAKIWRNITSPVFREVDKKAYLKNYGTPVDVTTMMLDLLNDVYDRRQFQPSEPFESEARIRMLIDYIGWGRLPSLSPEEDREKTFDLVKKEVAFFNPILGPRLERLRYFIAPGTTEDQITRALQQISEPQYIKDLFGLAFGRKAPQMIEEENEVTVRESKKNDKSLDMTWLIRSVEWVLKRFGMRSPYKLELWRRLIVSAIEPVIFFKTLFWGYSIGHPFAVAMAVVGLFGFAHTGRSFTFKSGAVAWASFAMLILAVYQNPYDLAGHLGALIGAQMGFNFAFFVTHHGFRDPNKGFKRSPSVKASA